jgi:D-alanyl-D-alanine carboxypeptidase
MLLLALGGCDRDEPAPPPPPPPRDPIAERLQSLLEREAEACDVPGAVLLVQSPRRRWVGAAGLADPRRGVPLRPTDNFRIASITKTFVAAALLRLREEGKLRIDDPLSKWLPNEVLDHVANGHRLRLDQLLNMTSGVPDYIHVDGWKRLVRHHHPEPYEALDMVNFIFDAPADFAPGEEWDYCNTNYLLAQMVLEKAAGNSMTAELRRLVIDPLQLRDTFNELHEPRPSGFGGLTTRGHEAWHDRPYDVTEYNESLGLADGGLISTAADLQHFLQALLHDRTLLRTDSLRLMMKFDRRQDYGLGLDRTKTAFGPSLGHTGDGAGFCTEARYFPDYDAYVVLLTTRTGNDLYKRVLEPALSLAMQ